PRRIEHAREGGDAPRAARGDDERAQRLAEHQAVAAAIAGTRGVRGEQLEAGKTRAREAVGELDAEHERVTAAPGGDEVGGDAERREAGGAGGADGHRRAARAE